MRKKRVALIALMGVILSATAPAMAQKKGGTLRLYHNDNPPSTSLLEESTIASVMPFAALFNNLVAFDPAKPQTSKIAFTVDVGSATMGSRETDAELPKATWFNVPKFPQASFQSSSIKALGGGKFEVAGQLSIKGNARDVVVPVALTQSGTVTTATGTLPLKRLAFKIGENEWADTSMVANEVQVKFKLALTGLPG